MQDTLTITLKKEVEFNEEKFYELALREPYGSEIEQMTKDMKKDGEYTAILKLVAAVSDVPLPAVRKIGSSDIKKASDFLLAFIDDSQPTGEK